MSVFRTSDDGLYINALVLRAEGSRLRPGFSLTRRASRIYASGVFLSCINLAIVVLAVVSMFLFRFPTRLSVPLYSVLLVWSTAVGSAASLSPLILGTIRTELDFGVARLEVKLSKLYYFNFALFALNIFTFVAVAVVGGAIERSALPRFSLLGILCACIVFWSGYCYLQVSRRSM